MSSGAGCVSAFGPWHESDGTPSLNATYLSVGIAMILALVTALLGPLFVDWNDYKVEFEREAAAILGQQVTVIGDIHARLLPTPTATLGDVVIGRVEAPLARVAAFRLDIDPMPLLKGDIHVNEMRLERPEFNLVIRADGTLAPTAPVTVRGRAADAGGIALADVGLIDGRVVIRDERADREFVLDQINATASATALAGPWRLEGVARHKDASHAFRVSTSPRDAGGTLPVRLRFAQSPDVQTTFDGLLRLGAAEPALEGDLSFVHAPTIAKGDKGAAPPLAWRIAARVKGDARAIDARDVGISVGPEERAYALAGSARVDLGADPRLQLALSARHVDLDRAIARATGAAVATADVADAIAAALVSMPKPPLPTRLALEVPGIVAGGSVASNFRLDAESLPQGWRIESLAVDLPGKTRLALSGRIDTLVAAGFAGRVRLDADQPAVLAQWLGRPLSTRPDPLRLAGDLAMGGNRFGLDDLTIDHAGARLRGKLAYSPVRDHGPGGRFDIDIDADKLDVDAMRGLAGILGSGGSGDPIGAIGVKLWAGNASWGRAQARELQFQGTFADDTLSVAALSVADLGGAGVTASGKLDHLSTAPDGTFELAVKAARLDGVLALARELAPDHAATRWFERAARHLAPLDLTARLDGSTSNAQLAIDAKGTLAGTDLAAAGRFDARPEHWRNGPLSLDIRLVAPKGGLIRQLGLAGATRKPAAETARVTIAGTPRDKLAVAIAADLVDGKLGLVGHVGLPEAGAGPVDLTFDLDTPDLAGVLDLTPHAELAPAGTLSTRLRARLNGTTTRLAIADLDGRIGDTAIKGNLELDRAGALPRLTGTLAADALDLRDLTEPLLGADAWTADLAAGKPEPWPTTPFAPPAGLSLTGRVAIRTERLRLSDAIALDKVGFDLTTTADQLNLEALSGNLLGGTANGALRLRIAPGGEIRFGLDARLAGLDAARLGWIADTATPALTGKLDASLIGEASGRSIAAIVANLTGSGLIAGSGLKAARTDPRAFAAVTKAADAGLALEDSRIRPAFAAALAKDSLSIERLEAPIAIAGGIARMSNFIVAARDAGVTGSASLDLAKLTLDGEAILGVDPGRDAIQGAEPRIAFRFAGPLAAPGRSLDTEPFLAWLTLRAYEREAARAQALQSEIIERERFARELRRLKEDRARREAEALAERKRQEDEARRLLQQQSPPGLPPAAPVEPSGDFEKRIRSAIDPPATGGLRPLPPPVVIPPAPPIGIPANP